VNFFRGLNFLKEENGRRMEFNKRRESENKATLDRRMIWAIGKAHPKRSQNFQRTVVGVNCGLKPIAFVDFEQAIGQT
jgi:hypothetical protein